MKVLILNGPNINLLGRCMLEVYGDKTLDVINAELLEYGQSLGHEIVHLQSNHEGILIDRIHDAILSSEGAPGYVDAIIVNPGPLGQTSTALADALKIFDGPKAEVHISLGGSEFHHPTIISAGRQFGDDATVVYRQAFDSIVVGLK